MERIRIVEADEAEFDDSERLRDGELESLFKLEGDLLADGAGGGNRQPHGGNGGRRFVLGEHRVVERRCVEHGAAPALHGVEERRRKDVTCEDHRRALREIENDRHQKVVRHRQRPDDGVVRCYPERPVGGGDSIADGFVSESDASARTGGAGGKANEGEIEIVMAGAGIPRVTREEAVRLDLNAANGRRGAENGVELQGFNDLRGFAFGAFDGHGHDDDLQFPQRKRERHVIDTVGEMEADSAAGWQRELGKDGGESMNLPGEFQVGDPDFSFDERWLVRPRCGRFIQQFDQIHIAR